MANQKEDDIIVRHPMIIDLEEISKIDRLVVKHANFENGNIVVAVKGGDLSFDGVMSSIKFVDMVDKMSLEAVDFETGEITVRWYPKGFTKLYTNLNVTKEEIDLIQRGKKINAIKEVRNRTGMGLLDAKTLVENVSDELRRRGVI